MAFQNTQIEPAVDPYVGRALKAWFVTRTPLKKTFYPRKIEGFCKLLMLYFVLYFFGNAVFLQQVLYFCAVVSVVKCRTNSNKIPLRGSLEKDETNESLKISLSFVFMRRGWRAWRGRWGPPRRNRPRRSRRGVPMRRASRGRGPRGRVTSAAARFGAET